MKRGLKLLFAILLATNTAFAQEKATLSAEIYGYKQEMVYFDCVQTPLVSCEFYTNPGEIHSYTFDCDGLVCIMINSRTKVLLQPGDSLHVNISYDGRKIKSIKFSGSERAVNNNMMFNNINNIKRNINYKSQLLTCAALDIKPKNRIDDSRTLHGKVKEMLANSQATPEAQNYAMAIVDSDVYLSFMEYPVMYASIRGTAIDKQEIGDYASIMNDAELRSDAQALSCPEYASLLMRYCFYKNEMDAAQNGTTYQMPTRFEDMYKELAAFYNDEQRDFVLYTLLCNFIRNGQEIERADALYNDYVNKYNKNAGYKSILDALLQ